MVYLIAMAIDAFSNEDLIKRIPQGDRRALSRMITLVENRFPRAREVQAALYKKRKAVHVIGITGSPGAGKSTLVDQVARRFREAGKEVAVLAVDPSSPFSGGAVLGDRIRMHKALEDASVFVRSMATRGSLGGLARSTMEVVELCAAAGFDVVIIETVGVGQAEVDVVKTADTSVVVLVPGMGDSVQAIKAGILEIADVFAINKADREGYDRLHRDIRTMLSLVPVEEGAWEPDIVKTVATEGTGIPELIEKIEEHHKWLETSQAGKEKQAKRVAEYILRLVHDLMLQDVEEMLEKKLPEYVKACINNENDPYSIAKALVKRGQA